MRSGTVAFLAGVIWLQQWASLPPAWWSIGLLLLAPLLWRLSSPRHLPVALLCGFLWASLQGHWVLASGIGAEHEGRDIVIRGRITDLPVYQSRSVRFVMTLDTATLDGQRIAFPARVRLNWYGHFPRLVPGERWRLMVRLKQPHGFLNPGGFDYEGWLFQQRIRATGYVRKSGENRRLADPRGQWSNRLRHHLRQRIHTVLAESEGRGLLLALIMGDQSEISADQWQLLQRTGTGHLMAISGLHIGLVAGLAFWLGQWLWRFSGRGLLWLPAPRAGAVAAILAAFAYAALAGFAIPTQRALIMVAVTMLALLSSRPVNPVRSLALAMLVILLLDPLAVLSPGFWLSFLAVGLIFYGLSGRTGRLPGWKQGIRIQGMISLGMLPVAILLFQQASLVSPLANLVAVPVVGLLVVPVALAGSVLLLVWPWGGAGLLNLAVWLIEHGNGFLVLLGQWSLASWSSGGQSLVVVFLAMFGLAQLLAPRGWPLRWMGLVLLLPLVFYHPERPAWGQARFTLLDVGQGLAAVVQTRSHALVFDTGPRFSDRFDTGNAVVLPYLRAQGIERLDRLVISHGDSDHIGGAFSVLSQLSVDDIFSSVPEKLRADRVSACRRGQAWQWDGVDFQMLHPADDELQRNDASCVLRIQAGEQGVLLTGDIEKPAEKRLLRRQAGRLRADILVAPHHGSNTSSSRDFIRQVAPDYVLFAVGYRNRYRFPRQAVTGRYETLHARLLQTDRTGAISFVLGGGTLKADLYREKNRRYWHHGD